VSRLSVGLNRSVVDGLLTTYVTGMRLCGRALRSIQVVCARQRAAAQSTKKLESPVENSGSDKTIRRQRGPFHIDGSVRARRRSAELRERGTSARCCEVGRDIARE